MGEDGKLLDRHGFVSILSGTNHLKTQAEAVLKDFSPFVMKLFNPSNAVGVGGEGCETKMLTLPFSFKS